MMKKTILLGIGLLLLPFLVRSQSGLVSSGGDCDYPYYSTMTVGQIFTLGVLDAGYLNEGLQQSFLYRGGDTLLEENINFPVTYRPAERSPLHTPHLVLHPGHTDDSLYFLPTRGLDTLLDVMAYGVTYVNDTTVVAPYSSCEVSFALQSPLILPAGSVPPVQYYNNAPAIYGVPSETPVTWNFHVADKSLSDVQMVNVMYPPCGNDNFRVYTSAATTYPFVERLSTPYHAEDYEGNLYESVRLACLCWTKENLKSSKYSDGSDVSNPMVYVSDDYPDTTANLNQYGYLYTWDDAMHSPVDSGTTNVQGICPNGWRVPTLAELQLLAAYPSTDLKTTYDWLSSDGTNLTDFSALPAGKYTDGRFENLKGETGFWTTQRDDDTSSNSFNLQFYCGEPVETISDGVTGLSVRCVKGN